MNQVILAGRLGQDPETRGSAVKLRLATTERRKTKEGAWENVTEWHTVTLFGSRGAALCNVLGKGDFIVVRGRLSTSSYEKNGEKRYSTEVIADDVELTGRKDGGERTARRDTPRDDFGYGGADDSGEPPF